MCSRKIGVLMMGLLCSLGVASQVDAAEQSSAAVGDAAQSASQGKKKQSRSAKSRGENGVEEVYVKGSYTARSMNGATGIEMSLRETPQTITIMTSQMIADKGLVDMEQVLDHVPGVSKVGDASEYSIMYVRGFPLDTGVQVDGMITTPANSGYSGDVSQSIDRSGKFQPARIVSQGVWRRPRLFRAHRRRAARHRYCHYGAPTGQA